MARLPAEQHYLKASIVIQVSMERRDNNLVMFMLKVRKLLREKPGVMVVDQCYGSHDGSLRGDDCAPHESISNQVSECLGSIVVAFLSDELVKTIE
ncbi:MAG TPA: hypothetical protein VKV39_02765 [Candidatus Sulfotelmatobacter sp.]|nr:hypothetical protein [Candidatus Sulfotelmatobacter sp.]